MVRIIRTSRFVYVLGRAFRPGLSGYAHGGSARSYNVRRWGIARLPRI
jgi:hypothetical protein